MEKKVLEFLQFIDFSKVAGIDKISERFLKWYKYSGKTHSKNM